MDIAAFNNFLFELALASEREREVNSGITGGGPKVEEIFFKISIPWGVGVLMNFCQRISPWAAFGRLNQMPRSMVMRSAKFCSIFCPFHLTWTRAAAHIPKAPHQHTCAQKHVY